MHPQVNVVTIGAADTGRAKEFYAALGFLTPARDDTSLHLGSATFTIGDWNALAHEAGVSSDSHGFRGCTLSATFESAAEAPSS